MGRASSINCEKTKFTAEVITKNHKPDDKEETRRIEELGGTMVKQKNGTTTVAWNGRETLKVVAAPVKYIALKVSHSST